METRFIIYNKILSSTICCKGSAAELGLFTSHVIPATRIPACCKCSKHNTRIAPELQQYLQVHDKNEYTNFIGIEQIYFGKSTTTSVQVYCN